jgi:predicted transcriptional regulator
MNEGIGRIKIIKEQNELELEGSVDFIERMLKKYEKNVFSYNIPASGIPSSENFGTPTITQSKPAGKSLSVAEFIRTLGLKKHTDIVLAFAYYVEEYNGVKAFTPADINNCYYESKMDSSNTSQMLIQLTRRGHIMLAKQSGENKGKKAYTITNTGIDFIKEILQAAEKH